MTGYVLDANALYRFLVGGENAERVAELFEQASDSNQNLSMSVVNWGEVYYTIMRGAGRDIANRTMAQVQGLPLRVWDADELLTRQAADLRASYGCPTPTASPPRWRKRKRHRDLGREGFQARTLDPDFAAEELRLAIAARPGLREKGTKAASLPLSGTRLAHSPRENRARRGGGGGRTDGWSATARRPPNQHGVRLDASNPPQPSIEAGGPRWPGCSKVWDEAEARRPKRPRPTPEGHAECLVSQEGSRGIRGDVCDRPFWMCLALFYLVAERNLAPCIISHMMINLFVEPGLVLAAVRGEKWASR